MDRLTKILEHFKTEGFYSDYEITKVKDYFLIKLLISELLTFKQMRTLLEQITKYYNVKKTIGWEGFLGFIHTLKIEVEPLDN
jgi:hypothetical protein